MGIALANEAANAGAEVTLVVGQITVLLPTHPQIKIIHIESTNDLFKTISNEFTQTDILIMAAAVADFEPETVATQKIKKSADNDEFLLKLKKTPDILKTVGATKKDQLVVGFAAETQGLLANAQKKLIKKNADLIIANNVATPGIGFASDDNQVTLLERDQDPKQLPKMTKNELAAHLIKLIATKIN
jgi:phosphopantothenoylcysteine decarboxylase/phosphopantothenate--cysteine ligase